MPETVFVAMSGGVDSSAAALLLLEQGYRVVGVTLRLYDSCGAPASRGCCALEDAADARAVAKALGIEHRVLEYQVPFEREVIEPFVAAYAAGRTPNPCIACNERVKFGALWEYALANGGDRLATGHHARLVEAGGRVDLRRAADREKDQSYVLFPLTLEQRQRDALPRGRDDQGGSSGPRRGARAFPPPTSGRARTSASWATAATQTSSRSGSPWSAPAWSGTWTGASWASTGGCTASRWASARASGSPSPSLSTWWRWTPGPRRFWSGRSRPSIRRSFLAEGWNWHFPEGSRPAEAEVQVRYHQEPRPATLVEGPGGLVVTWSALPQCVTPGQAAVAYVDDTVVGGGWIVGRRA